MSDATRLLLLRNATKPILEGMRGTCDLGDPPCPNPSFAGFMHGHCPAHAEEFDLPVGALKDQSLMENLEKAIAAVDEDLGMGTPWPLHEVLGKLIGAARHLLDEHSCDTYGHEEIREAINAAEKIRATLLGPEGP